MGHYDPTSQRKALSFYNGNSAQANQAIIPNSLSYSLTWTT
ncbi:Hypothetical protein CpCAPJ4_02069 [Corynebacterium pseudotuberculosis]|nr:Hypothetical protein Cp3995_2114 [Corynebacterium pseudotuberculosis 3/99-5]AIG06286.1 hypothetical protein CPTA_00457 [Corynebacterium pseudotuberculosis]AKC74826.1 Hypothetical protein Cp226_2142 [Corynebacterium pseudotuberculosis]ATQ66390.1 Hypothetical protein CpPA07_2110 [Corynebacterium pseudotuberculosis]AUY59327.1 Hypothetical protein CpCAPJ4_02069 [Corynebacterium pseudotuberculosis]